MAAARSNSDAGGFDNHRLSSQGGSVDIDTALLRAFVATDEERHFGRAARRLFISQQALSKRIRRLESLLGVRVLDRGRDGVELTGAGRVLLPYAREAVDAVDAGAAAIGSAERADDAVSLRVDVLYEHLAPLRLLRASAADDPALRLAVTTRNDLRPVVPALRRGDFDLAFGRALHRPWPADIVRRLVLLEPIGLLVGAAHPFADRVDVRLDELRGLRLWFPLASAPEDWTTLLDELCATYGLTLDRTVATMGFADYLDRTSRDPTGASFLGMGMDEPTGPGLRVVPIVAPQPVFAWSAMWRRRIPDRVVARLLAHLPRVDPAALDRAADPARVWLPDIDRAALRH